MKISIITPNYNYATYIGETIKSVIEQDYDDVEHIIVDDGSTDHSVAIIAEFVAKYPNKIRLIRQENQGQTKAINNGLKSAAGDILGWINSDDFYCPHVFHFINDYFQNHTEVDLIFSDLIKVDENSTIIGTKKYLEFDLKAGCLLGFGNLIANNTAFFRASVLKRVGLLNENLHYVMDSEFWFRVGRTCVIEKVDQYIGNFRVHPLAKSQKPELFRAEEEQLFKLFYTELAISNYLPYALGKNLKFAYLIKRKLTKLMDRR